MTQLPTNIIRVMLVDDHQTMLWGLSRLIDGEHERMRVVGTAGNGADALAQAERLRPDVILLDLDLNGHSSLDILPQLLASSASVRVIVLTAERNQSALDQAVKRGARGVLRKDVPAEQVLQAIVQVHQGALCLDPQTLARVFSQFTEPRTPLARDPEAERHAGLTVRELKVIQAVVKGSGALNKALAQSLFISEHTLRNHLTSIYQKLGVNNRLELYVYALKHQLEKKLEP